MDDQTLAGAPEISDDHEPELHLQPAPRQRETNRRPQRPNAPLPNLEMTTTKLAKYGSNRLDNIPELAEEEVTNEASTESKPNESQNSKGTEYMGYFERPTDSNNEE